MPEETRAESGGVEPAFQPTRGRGLACGILGATLVLALANAVAIELTLPLPLGGVPQRLAHHAADAAETLGVGTALALAAGLATAQLRLPRWAAAVLWIALIAALEHPALGEYEQRWSGVILDGRLVAPLWVLLVLVWSAAPVALYNVGSLFWDAPGTGLVAVFAGGAAIVAKHYFEVDDGFAPHCVAAVTSSLLAGGALSSHVDRALRALSRTGAGKGALAALAAAAIAGLAVPPGNALRFELFRQPCSCAPWVLATLAWPTPALRGQVSPPSSASWALERVGVAPVTPSNPRLLGAAPVVVLVTVDALRGDVIDDPSRDDLLPTFARLKREGVYFRRAMSPATQTAVTLSTLFTGRMFSELAWTDYGTGKTRYLYPTFDPSVRFPELLTARGVATVNFAGLSFLAADYGVAKGFAEQTVAVTGWRHARARELVDPLLARLERVGDGPAFLYTHLMEPHEPYDRGRTTGTPFERYVSEVAVVDAQLARIVAAVDRLGPRAALLVSADHGEAFGEHRGYQHGKTLYEELLHVPLLAYGAALQAHVVPERVGLVDVGPTILDLFGLDTPAAFLGQSLAPALGGAPVRLERPLLAEGRLRRALVTPDGLKVIEDLRRRIIEAYDLERDPREVRNLYDVEAARVDAALAQLRAAFDAHTLGGPGAWPPYKP